MHVSTKAQQNNLTRRVEGGVELLFCERLCAFSLVPILFSAGGMNVLASVSFYHKTVLNQPDLWRIEMIDSCSLARIFAKIFCCVIKCKCIA